jgi:hypothetical protein
VPSKGPSWGSGKADLCEKISPVTHVVTGGISIDLAVAVRAAGAVASFLLGAAMAAGLAPSSAAAAEVCGEVVKVATHAGTTTRYALARPRAEPAHGDRIALLLLVGGGGHLDLDESGCPRALGGNFLVRAAPLLREAGFFTALVDASSDHADGDGLAGFRAAAEHASDLGRVIADLRTRANAAVWAVGTSRGTISAANAAARLSGAPAPEGLVLASALTSGDAHARKAWVAQTVFDLPLEMIRTAVLVVGHGADMCIRTPAELMSRITARTNAVREQIVIVTGGPGIAGGPSVAACEARAPHGFVEQEAEVAAGIARFIRGARY